MTVFEIMKKLATLPAEHEVVCWLEDEELQAPGHVFRILDILNVRAVTGELRRGEDQLPTMAIGPSDSAETIATIEVTAHH